MAKPTLRQGSKGPDVNILQAALNALPAANALLIVDGVLARRQALACAKPSRHSAL